MMYRSTWNFPTPDVNVTLHSPMKYGINSYTKKSSLRTSAFFYTQACKNIKPVQSYDQQKISVYFYSLQVHEKKSMKQIIHASHKLYIIVELS